MKSFKLVVSVFVIFCVSIAQINGTSSPCLMEILRNIFSTGTVDPYAPVTPRPPPPPYVPGGYPTYPPYTPYPPYPTYPPYNPNGTIVGPVTPPPTCAPCPTAPALSCPTAPAPALSCPACTTPVPPTCPPPPPTQALTFGSSLPCGTFIEYDIANSTVVVNNGFSAGVYKDGSQAYVGIGINFGCLNEYNCPGRISVVGSQGVFMSCLSGVLDPYTPRFLVNHPDLHWVSAIGQTLTSVPGLVRVKSASSFFIGRANLTANGQTYTTVSKTSISGDMLYSDGTSAGYTITTNIEVLSC